MEIRTPYQMIPEQVVEDMGHGIESVLCIYKDRLGCLKAFAGI